MCLPHGLLRIGARRNAHLERAGYVTPKDKLEGRDPEIFAARDRKLAEARERRKQQRQANPRGPAQPAARPAIDFAAVCAAVTMAAVLHLLGFQPCTSRGAQQRGPCPLHGATAGAARCFSVNLEDHTFHCFRCGRSGNALDLWPTPPARAPTTRPWICASAWASPRPSCRRRRPATEKRNP